jgi:hypothetical protein
VDHKDGDGLNNSRSNLRLATNQENAQHRRIRAGPKSSIFKGVYLNKRYGTWQAQIKILGKRKFLGRFDIEEDAGFAYNQAAAIYGEFALLNELEDNYIPTQIHIKRPKSSQYMGVYWNKQSNNWRARIRIDGKDKSLGCFENEEEAARTYDRAALKRDVNCLVLNFPLSNYLISVPEIGAMV